MYHSYTRILLKQSSAIINTNNNTIGIYNYITEQNFKKERKYKKKEEKEEKDQQCNNMINIRKCNETITLSYIAIL